MSNSAPVLGVASNAEFIRDRDETALSPALTVSGADGATLAWASVVITDGFRPGDHLAADTGATRTAANYDADTGVLTLTGTETLAHYRQVLQTVRYRLAGQDADDHSVTQTRDIAWQVSDGIDWTLPQITRLTIAVASERCRARQPVRSELRPRPRGRLRHRRREPRCRAVRSFAHWESRAPCVDGVW